MTTESYIQVLEHVSAFLRSKRKLPTTIFQQDGAPPNFSTTVRDFLTRTFRDRVIGRGFDIPWPARSPDLTPLDYWYWSVLKDRIYSSGQPAYIT